MQKYFNNVTNKKGDIVPNANITVTVTATGALAVLYSDNGVTTTANPLTADANGYFEFYADNGRYNITTSGAELTTSTITDISIVDTLEPNLTTLGSVGGDGDKSTRILYGAIRQATAGAGWSFINDAAHEPNGFTDSITVNGSGELIVPYNFTASQVGMLSCTTDETFAALDMQMGASVGASSATIALYKTLYATVDLATLVCTPSSYFTGLVTAVNNGNGTVTITHPAIGATGATALIENKTKYKTAVTSSSATTTTIESVVEFSGYISYDGANWVVSTPCLVKPTMVFSAGTLTVTHSVFGTTENTVMVTARDSSNTICAIGNCTSTNFTVVFRDYSGTVITTPSTNMRFFYQGTQMQTREVPIGTILLTRPICKLNASNVFAASGNIWLSGSMVV